MPTAFDRYYKQEILKVKRQHIARTKIDYFKILRQLVLAHQPEYANELIAFIDSQISFLEKKAKKEAKDYQEDKKVGCLIKYKKVLSEQEINEKIYGKDDPLYYLVETELTNYPQSAQDIFEALLPYEIEGLTVGMVSKRLGKLKNDGLAISRRKSNGHGQRVQYYIGMPEEGTPQKEIDLMFCNYYKGGNK